MSKRTKMLATLGLVIVIIGGVIFAWYNLSGKTEQGNSKDTEIVQVEETIVEEEEFTWVDEEDISSNPMIVSNPCNIYAEPREDATVLGSLSAEQTGTNIAYAYDKAKSEGGIHLGWNKVNFGGIEGYVSLMDVSYDVPMETDEVVAEESTTEESTTEEATTEEAKSGVSETESIVEAEPKAEETKKDESKKEEVTKDETKKDEVKKEEPQQQAETPAPQPEPAPEPAPAPAPQAQTGVVDGINYDYLNQLMQQNQNNPIVSAPAGNTVGTGGYIVE